MHGSDHLQVQEQGTVDVDASLPVKKIYGVRSSYLDHCAMTEVVVVVVALIVAVVLVVEALSVQHAGHL